VQLINISACARPISRDYCPRRAEKRVMFALAIFIAARFAGAADVLSNYIALIRETNLSASVTAWGETSSETAAPLNSVLFNAENLLRDFPLSPTGASSALQALLPPHARRAQVGPPLSPGGLGFPFLLLRLSTADALLVLRHPSVAMLERDVTVRAVGSAAYAAERNVTVRAMGSEPTASAALDRLDQRSLPLDGAFRFSQTGVGVVMFVVDSGLRSTHVEFAGRVLPGANFAPDAAAEDTTDLNGHGTHVASLAAGATLGVAQGARVVPVRIYDATNEGPLSQALMGVDWILGAIKSTALRGLRYFNANQPRAPKINDPKKQNNPKILPFL
jgi:hypothetical protein